MIAIAQISVMVDLDTVDMPLELQTQEDYYYAKSFVRSLLVEELENRLGENPIADIDELIGYQIVASLDELEDTTNPN